MKDITRKLFAMALSTAIVLSGSPAAALANDTNDEAATVEAAPEEIASEEAAPVEAVPEEAAPVEAEPAEAAPIEAEPTDEKQSDKEEATQEPSSEDASDPTEAPVDNPIVVEEEVRAEEVITIKDEETGNVIELGGEELVGAIPGSTKDVAQEIPKNAKITVTFNPSTRRINTPSEHWWKVTLPTDGRLRFSTVTNMDTYKYTVYSASDNEYVSSISFYGAPEPVTYSSYMDLTGGTYYIRFNATGESGTLTLTTKYTRSSVSYMELPGGSNNTINTATKVNLNTKYGGQIAINDDTDVYKFTLPSAGRARIFVSGQLNMFGTLYNQSGKPLATMTLRKDSETGILDYNRAFDLTKGTYYFKLNRYYPETSGYSFKCAFTASKEAFSEAQGGSDNSMATANRINLNNKYCGQIAMNDTVDYYKFTMPSAGNAKFTCSGKLDLIYTIYDSSGKRVTSGIMYRDSSSGILDYSKNINLAKGTYYISFERYASQTSGYAFTISSPS